MTFPLLRASSLIVIVFVVVLFLFPVALGPYSASHGPVTTFRASRAAQAIWLLISLCGKGLLALSSVIFFAPITAKALDSDLSRLLAPAHGLRC